MKVPDAMPLDLVTVPCLADNYAFLIHDDTTGRTALVDAPEVAPIREALDSRGWSLSDLLITHHHYDHVDGVEGLREIYGCRVIGARADEARLPPLDLAVAEGDVEGICGEDTHIFDVSGHTVGHIAFYMPGPGYLFSADSLMALGCGRLFEGSPAQMWQSLLKLRDLPDETTLCSGHEYTAANAAFARTIEPDNTDLISRIQEVEAARAAGQPTVPSNLGLEKRTNPFLRADTSDLQSAIGMTGADPAEVFAEVRKRKDNF